MGIRILYDAHDDRAALYRTPEGVAFGPVFDGTLDPHVEILGRTIDTARDVAEAFLDYMQISLGVQNVALLDTRTLTNTYRKWRAQARVRERA